ncbi:MAG: DctP family TRAP transporter solute-binding subunit [Magnetococcales bacterium]|nr:DctP family TRAP transporter solute-binding subunit [Magnetococcales bacterium]
MNLRLGAGSGERQLQAALVVLLVLVLTVLGYRLHRNLGGPDETGSVPVQEPKAGVRLGLNIPAGTALYAAAMRFAGEVDARSHGRMRISVHPNQELGTDDQMLEMARRGELSMLLIPTAKLTVDLPAMQVLDLPFYFPTREALHQALDGDPGRILLDKVRAIGLEGITIWENGFKHFTANRPLRGPEDFAGLRVRVMKNRVIMEQFRLWNALPISIDFHATRKALEEGVVAAQENPLAAIVSMGFHEVQSHLTLSGHAYLGYLFAISRKFLATLGGEEQRLLMDAARTLTPWQREESLRREAGFLETIRKAGVEVHALDAGARERLRREVAHLPGRFAEMIGADVIAKTEEALLLPELASADGRETLLIGADLQLSGESALTGLEIIQGASLAVEEINREGGVLGRPLRLIARDHYGLATRGVENIRFFSGLKGLVAVLGGQKSVVVNAELDLVHQLELPLLLPWSAAQRLVENGFTPNYAFRISLNDGWAGPYLVNAALKRGKRVALVLENSSWGQQIGRTMHQHLTSLGLAPVGVWWLDNGITSAAQQVTGVGDSGAEVVVLVDTPDESMVFLEELAQKFPAMPVLSHWSLLGARLDPARLRLMGKMDLRFPQTLFFTMPGAEPVGIKLMERYRAALRLENDERLLQGPGFAHAYDLVRILARAIRQGNSVERPAVRDALERIREYEGVVKRYAPPFDARHHDALGPDDYRLARMTAEGRIVPAPEKGAP